MFQWARNLVGLGGGSRPSGAATSSRGGSKIQGRYENAQTTDENKRNWWAVDYLSAKAANSFQVRRVLRMRSRHEVSNNPYLFGICDGNANDLIGTGPTLKVTSDNATYNRIVERAFAEWWDAVDGAEKLRTLKLAKTVDGEGFLILKTVNDLDNPVKLYPCDVEADQVTTPAPQTAAEYWVDGMTLHPVTQRPVSFHVLNHHPGDFFFPDLNPLAVTQVPAKHVIHWFHKFRPGQVRGVPVFTPALDLFSDLRSFRRSTVGAAQIAAEFASVLETMYPADTLDDPAGSGAVDHKPFDRVNLERGAQVILPYGMKMSQFKAEHPTTTYEMFTTAGIGEACRPLNYPLLLALGTAQKFNFSSAKLDFVNYRGGLDIERVDGEKVALNKMFRAWFEEARLIPDLLPAGASIKRTPTVWHWPAYSSIDPLVDVQATAAAVAAGQLTLRKFWADRGEDWLEMLKQLQAEKNELEKLGLMFGDVVQRSISDTQVDDEGNPKSTKGEPANAA